MSEDNKRRLEDEEAKLDRVAQKLEAKLEEFRCDDEDEEDEPEEMSDSDDSSSDEESEGEVEGTGIEAQLRRIARKKRENELRIKDLRSKATYKRIKRDQNVHLVFLCDCTGSMSGAINQAKKNCIKISALVKRFFANFKMEVAFVGYRDIKDSKPFEIRDFDDAKKLPPFLSGVKATGGGDGPEDVFGGIEKVLNLTFDQDHPTRILIHMADAPCHGREYHSMTDDYPDGDPKGRDIKKFLEELADMRIHYFFIQIGSPSYTDTMCQKFKEMYEKRDMEFTIYKEKEDFLTLFQQAIRTSISKSQVLSAKEIDEMIERMYEL